MDLCSQPTCSRAENVADLRTEIRLGEVLVDLWLSRYATPPASVTLDIDDTLASSMAISNCCARGQLPALRLLPSQDNLPRSVRRSGIFFLP